jgi:hypothetical protein
MAAREPTVEQQWLLSLLDYLEELEKRHRRPIFTFPNTVSFVVNFTFVPWKSRCGEMADATDLKSSVCPS